MAYLRPGPFYDNRPEASTPWDPTAFREFIDAAFGQFIAAGAKSVLIDLRDNPGGDNSFSDPMVAWFADQPFRFSPGFDIKVSEAAVESNRKRLDSIGGDEDSTSRQLAAAYQARPAGSRVMFPIPLVPPRKEGGFKGKVYLLINRHSYSNTVLVAAIAQDYRFGKVLGEETADLASTYGALEKFTLPLTGIEVSFPKARILRPNGDPQARGVVPDIAIVTPLAAGSTDTVLEEALALVRAAGLRQATAAPVNRLGGACGPQSPSTPGSSTLGFTSFTPTYPATDLKTDRGNDGLQSHRILRRRTEAARRTLPGRAQDRSPGPRARYRCGAGQSTRHAARAAREGSAVGMDISEEMLQVARLRSAEEGLRNVAFELADAQDHAFPAAYFDLCISRFGRCSLPIHRRLHQYRPRDARRRSPGAHGVAGPGAKRMVHRHPTCVGAGGDPACKRTRVLARRSRGDHAPVDRGRLRFDRLSGSASARFLRRGHRGGARRHRCAVPCEWRACR